MWGARQQKRSSASKDSGVGAMGERMQRARGSMVVGVRRAAAGRNAVPRRAAIDWRHPACRPCAEPASCAAVRGERLAR